ncbi:glycerophosphodiester phosphodiesterase [Angustibacter aerolatus]
MAHRGFSRDGLENTMTAFAAAVALGLTHVETDVHATRDGRLVAFHDHRLDRVTDRTGAIADLDWAQVRAARVGADERVPLLEDVLGTWPHLRVNVDVKDDPAVQPVADVVRRTGALRRVCITSFDDRRTAAVRSLLGPGLATSAGRAGVVRWRLGSALPGPLGVAAARPADRSAVAVQVPLRSGALRVVTSRSVEVAHRLGLQVHVWTVDDAPTMRRLLDLGVDGLISDRADTLVQVLRERADGRA